MVDTANRVCNKKNLSSHHCVETRQEADGWMNDGGGWERRRVPMPGEGKTKRYQFLFVPTSMKSALP